MSNHSFLKCLLIVLGSVVLLPSQAIAAPNIDCEVAIVGGGAAGMHTFYRLAPGLGSKVCLFERNDYFGGRIKDVDSPKGRGRFGVGALRVMDTQTVLFNLAHELGIRLDAVDNGEALVFARGQYRRDTNDFAGPGNPYPTVGVPDFPEYSCVGYDNYPGCFNDAYYQRLFNNAGPAPKMNQTIEDYSGGVLGAEEFLFLKDTFRFRGDFLSGVDARGYLDYLREDWDTCCTPSYPVGGMSTFILGMLDKGRSSGGRAFSSEPVNSINRSGSKYVLQTSKRTVTAGTIVIAVPPVGLSKIGGSIADTIKTTAQFNSIQPIRAITVTNWWTHNWWGDTIDRGWATPEGNFTFNFVEFAHSDYQKDQLATRSVYDDDPRTTEMWVDAYKTGGVDAVNKMVVDQLSEFFPDATITKAQITKTHFQDWPDAWYWLKKGSNFSNADIAVWALKPISGERVSLVGEAYNVNRSGWSDAAYKSSINTLNHNFGLALQCASVVSSGNKLTYVPFNSPSYVCQAL